MIDVTFVSDLPAGPEQVGAWHALPGAFERLAPPWETVRLVRSEGIAPGCRAELIVHKGPLRLRWTALHGALPDGFTDRMERGPFRHWFHQHRFVPSGDGAALRDELEIRPTGIGPVDRLAAGPLLETLRRQFVYRHRTTAGDLAAHAAANPGGRRLRITVTGANGLVGRNLCAYLQTAGHDVTRLVRRDDGRPHTFLWQNGGIPPEAVEGRDAVIHLAGVPVGPGRWNPRRRAAIHASRVETTRAVRETIDACSQPPASLLVAGGIAAYGVRRSGVLDETSDVAPDDGFLPRVTADWERAAGPDSDRTRVVVLRLGPVLWPSAGLLAPFARLSRLRLMPRFGGPDRWVSWIAPDDVLGAVEHLLLRATDLSGPVNLTAPKPVLQTGWLASLQQVTGRCLPIPVSARAVRRVFGAMADETVLSSLAVVPRRLLESGYRFRFQDLADALAHVLGRVPPDGHPDVRMTVR